MTDNSVFDTMFKPGSIAIAGVSRTEHSNHPGYNGLMFLRMLKESGYKGNIYPVNPSASEIEGVKAYPRITSLPERPDFVIVAVPRAAVPQVLEDCVTDGALNVHVCTAGFSETGEPEGKLLEEKVREIALKGGIHLIGPNCMGCHVPSVGMRMFMEVPLVPGPVAFISQSGGHANAYLRFAARMGIGFSKVVSYGNALIMDAPDFVQYFEQDDETRIVCMYLEGIKDGRKLIGQVADLNRVKPVVIWKGGLTGTGSRAAASHTGSLAGDKAIWDAFFRQTGAIDVGSIEEMADVTMTILNLKPILGSRVAVLGGGGGNNVATGDICADEDIDLPQLTPETINRLTDFISLVNQAVINPLDMAGVIGNIPMLRRVIEIIMADPLIDMIVMSVSPGFWISGETNNAEEVKRCISEVHRLSPEGKQVVIAMHDLGRPEEAAEATRVLREAGLTVYSSLRSACRAIRRVSAYYQFLSKTGLAS